MVSESWRSPWFWFTDVFPPESFDTPGPASSFNTLGFSGQCRERVHVRKRHLALQCHHTEDVYMCVCLSLFGLWMPPLRGSPEDRCPWGIATYCMMQALCLEGAGHEWRLGPHLIVSPSFPYRSRLPAKEVAGFLLRRFQVQDPMYSGVRDSEGRQGRGGALVGDRVAPDERVVEWRRQWYVLKDGTLSAFVGPERVGYRLGRLRRVTCSAGDTQEHGPGRPSLRFMVHSSDRCVACLSFRHDCVTGVRSMFSPTWTIEGGTLSLVHVSFV